MPEHLEIFGTNGSGKTFFETQILRARAMLRGSHVVFVATKKDDATIRQLGWPVIDRWPPDYGQDQVVYWIRKKGIGQQATARQAAKVRELLERIWQPQANIIVVIDEISYVETDLGLKHELMNYYREGRALGITMVASSQRPQGINRWVHSESNWTISFGVKDQDDAERVAEIFGNRLYYRDVIRGLNRERYEFLIKRNLTGESFISWVDHPLPEPTRQRR